MKMPTDRHRIVTKTLNNEGLNNEGLNNKTLSNVRLTRVDMVLSPRNKRPCYPDSPILD